VSPAVPITLIAMALALVGGAVWADRDDNTRAAVTLAGLAFVVFLVALATLPGTIWPTTPELPKYDPVSCADLAWLDGQWKCIPFEEQG